jgi:hypothetical protein
LPPPDPEHLFEQAAGLAADTESRQANLRRAISAAYYGLFHFTLTAAADMVLGSGNRGSGRYSLVYRSIDHSRLRILCTQLRGTQPKNLPFEPPGGFGSVADFARIAGNLQELRNLAEYDPSRDITPDEARVAISDARQAITWFQQGAKEQREAFLTLLLFKSR